MTFNIATAPVIASADIDYTNTTETEDALSALAPYSVWSGATTYASGDRVYVAADHHVYQSLAASNLNHDPTDTANIGVWWADAGMTNKFRPFDQITTNQCQKVSTNIRFRLECTTAVTVVALFGLSARSVAVMHYDTDAARRNLVTYSADQSNGVYTQTGLTSVTANAAADPFGGPLASYVREDSGGGNHLIQTPSVSFTSGLDYTMSIYVKRPPIVANRDVQLRFVVTAFSGVPTVTADLTAGTIAVGGVGGSGTITALDNGWYRVSITATADATAASVQNIYLYDGSVSYTGGGLSGLYTYGVQIEQASAPSTCQWIEDATRWGDVLFGQAQTVSATFSTNTQEVIFTDLTADVGDYIDITVFPDTGTDIAGVSEIAMGQNYPIGDTLDGPEISIIDYSNTTVDTFGNTTLVRRGYSKNVDAKIRIAKLAPAQTLNFLASARAVPIVFYDSEDVSNGQGTSTRGLLAYGIRLNTSILSTNSPILSLNYRSL